MPPNQGLSEEQIQRILDTYDDLGNMATVAEKLGHSKDTVQKYLHQRHPKWADDDGGGKASVDRSDIGDFEDPDYYAMNHHDFIKWFFNIPGNSKVNNDLVEIIAYNSQVRDQLPDADRMRNILEQGDSGIGNPSDVQMIVETYQKVMNDYMDSKGRTQTPPSQQPSAGAWMDTPQPGQGQQGAQGGWQSAQPGQGVGPAAGRTNPGGYQPPPPPGYYRPSEESKEQRREIRRLQKRLDEVNESIREGLSNNQEDEKQSPKEAIQELVEMQSALQQLQGDDSSKSDDAVRALKNEINQLQAKIAAESDGGDGDDSGLNSVLMQMAARDDADPEMMKTMADAFGATDPDVKKAELEFQAEQAKQQSRRQMIDAFFENISNLGGDNFETMLKIAENLTSPGQPQQPAPQGQPAAQPAQPAQAQQPAPQQHQPAQQPQHQQPESPARRRIESRASRAQQTRHQPSQDQRRQPDPEPAHHPDPEPEPEPEPEPAHHPEPEPAEEGGYWGGDDDNLPGSGGEVARSSTREMIERAQEAAESDPMPVPESESEADVEEVVEAPDPEPDPEPGPEEEEPEPEPEPVSEAPWDELTAEEIEERYDTSDYQSFAKECMTDYNGDGSICGKLWSKVQQSGGDDE